jgi:hypothetical protein
VKIDLSERTYNIVGVGEDGRDHVILLVDGPKFRHYLLPSMLIGVRYPAPDAAVHIFGVGLGAFPPERKDGKVDTKAVVADSDVDHEEGLFWYQLAIKHGDSGAAIYNEQGQVVGVINLGMGGLNFVDEFDESASFALGFSKETLLIAQSYEPKETQNGSNPSGTDKNVPKGPRTLDPRSSH